MTPTLVGEVGAPAVIAKTPDDWPAGIVTDAGTVAVAVLALDNATVAPPNGAAAVRLTVFPLRTLCPKIDEFARTIGVIADALARRSGRDPSDFAVRNLAGAVVGVIMATTLPLVEWPEKAGDSEMFDRIDAALAHLEAGLPL